MASSPEPVSSLQSLQLDLPPSCVEFCPAFPSYFLVGTYNLQKDEETTAAKTANSTNSEEDDDDNDKPTSPVKPQSRNGSIIVLRIFDKTLIQVQTVPQPSAILDLHFNPSPGHQELCAVVSSTGTLAIFQLLPDEDQPLKHIRTMDVATMSESAGYTALESGVILTSFCWHPLREETIAITTSAGLVYLVDLGPTGEGGSLYPEPVTTHSLEAWCVAISPSLVPAEQGRGGELRGGGAFMVFSGGDDSALYYRICFPAAGADVLDTDSDEDGQDEPKLAVRLRDHGAGVTAILPVALKGESQLVVTGSYDDHIRLFSVASTPTTYSPGEARKLAECNLGGGVWRLKLVQLSKNFPDEHEWRAVVLASCMHAGVRVVELSKSADGDYEFHVIGSFVEHKSMNYGSDIQPGWTDNLSVISTSFYDKLLCLWDFAL
ncbi:hypothetical protein B0H67DRAFT_568681 [Lasiosphaeris hirsuta]|uniref:Uncharacterized protein n=1 Tax=Lasiosphaeris hirsuta TaxID=260670 RepID=A0AA40AZB0_9PEZI|nr:hypothetical protein B0H67DRAFT_568681 [Lasiosphaeris hirsuta]